MNLIFACAGSRQADGCLQEDHKEGEILKY
jgi:hypothetical protein